MYIRKGSKETELIKEIQSVVGVVQDGVFGPDTESAVIKWQRKNYLVSDGIVGPKTLEAMGLLDTDNTKGFLKTESGLTIHKYHLPQGEYVDQQERLMKYESLNNDYIFIHHTAGWNNPYKTIDSWSHDSRGRVATEFIIGGQRITDGDRTYDGKVLQAFPEGGQGWHLGRTGSSYMNIHSVGIEMNNFGYLKKGKTYTGAEAAPDQICTLKQPFRGYEQWHKYSDVQLSNLKKLLEFVAERDNIDLREGLSAWIRKEGMNQAFEFKQEAYEGRVKGLLTHANVRKDKFDNSPQPELIDMLLSL